MSDSQYQYKTSCDKCGSSDARAVYANGTSWCFSCSSWQRDDDADHATPSPTGRKMSLLTYEYKDIAGRKIPEQVAKFFRYGYGADSQGVKVQVANYFNSEKEIVGQKLRYRDKDFKFVGDNKAALMFGQQLWGDTGKRLVITEGEIDAMSYAVATDCKWPVISLKNGAGSAKREIAANLEWINGYDEVYLWFDNDKAGRDAVEEVTSIIPMEKIRIVRHEKYKDCNDVLVHLGKSGVMQAYYNAERYKPDDIVTPMDLIDIIAEPIQMGFSYAYENLTQLMYGRRFGEVVVVGAGVSVGKTDFVMTQIAHDLKQGWKVATFMLEQSVKETNLRICGKINGIQYHIPDAQYDANQLRETSMSMQGNLYMFNNFGSNEWEAIKSKIRYMKNNYDVRIFYIDNLTALNSHAGDERRNLDALMAEVAGLAQELDIWVLLVSHLNPPKSGASHEAGGQTEQNQFTGSRAIMRWAYAMFGIERNTLHEDPEKRNQGTIRVLKDRFSGSATGRTVGFHYDRETGLVHETTVDFQVEQTEAENGSDF